MGTPADYPPGIFIYAHSTSEDVSSETPQLIVHGLDKEISFSMTLSKDCQ